jgi:hypothetical protein
MQESAFGYPETPSTPILPAKYSNVQVILQQIQPASSVLPTRSEQWLLR